MSTYTDQDPRLLGIKTKIRVVPNFPKPVSEILFGGKGLVIFPSLLTKILMAGIMFQDITTLLLDPKAFKDTIDLFVERYKGKNISVVAGHDGMEVRRECGFWPWVGDGTSVGISDARALGVEARGFIFGPPIALAIGAKFVPLRKPKKLPGKVISQEYILEYGRDCLEMHVGAVEAGERALVVDDLIATGGTLCAAMDLLERVGAEVVECACVIELPELKGRERLNGKPLYVLVEYY
ncbi:adenine phosphoribosyltransferase 4-like [Senna tora]|uniref:adenine phosphoribosyltransferase n=1 Tax=Senna tora TaxID=362788 RepID=A0A834WMF8_9FABA|nr:adenine phosphoribosyltransferase 4-like [Senna tora]